MFETIRNAWKIEDLRKKLIYTFIMLVIFRLGSWIPVPSLDPTAMSQLFAANNSMFGFLDIMSGGALQQATIFAMGITPYINASIIMQLLCVAIPALERLQKQGEEGRKAIAQIQRYATVVLALIQAVGLYFLLKSYGAVTTPGFGSAMIIVITLSAGTAFLMWLGEQITEKGVGNGISLIIFAGIVSGIPSAITSLYNYIQNGEINWIMAIALVVLVILVVAFVVWITDAERRIPVDIRFETIEEGFCLTIGDKSACFEASHQNASNPQRALQTIIQQLSKLGDSDFIVNNIQVFDKGELCLDTFPYFIPISQLNQWRRALTQI